MRKFIYCVENQNALERDNLNAWPRLCYVWKKSYRTTMQGLAEYCDPWFHQFLVKGDCVTIQVAVLPNTAAIIYGGFTYKRSLRYISITNDKSIGRCVGTVILGIQVS